MRSRRAICRSSCSTIPLPSTSRALEIPAELALEAAPEIIHHICATEQPQGIVAVFPLPTPSLPRSPRRVLILDAVRDPGNLGTILRTAAAAGVEVVLLAPGCVDPYNDKVLRSGMGAHFRVPVIAQKWDEIAVTCDGLAVYLAEMSGDVSYDAADWSRGVGADRRRRGARRKRAAATLADQRVSIPMAAETESLNAASATAIILFEAARQGR